MSVSVVAVEPVASPVISFAPPSITSSAPISFTRCVPPLVPGTVATPLPTLTTSRSGPVEICVWPEIVRTSTVSRPGPVSSVVRPVCVDAIVTKSSPLPRWMSSSSRSSYEMPPRRLWPPMIRSPPIPKPVMRLSVIVPVLSATLSTS